MLDAKETFRISPWTTEAVVRSTVKLGALLTLKILICTASTVDAPTLSVTVTLHMTVPNMVGTEVTTKSP